MVDLCERFGCLPEAGGLLDQPVDLLRMVALVDMTRGGGEQP